MRRSPKAPPVLIRRVGAMAAIAIAMDVAIASRGAAAQPPLDAPAAPSPPSDVIHLKTGGVLRGTLVDAIPNAQARIQLATGEIATVPWSLISRIEQASSQKGAAAAPSPTAGTIVVHVESPDPVTLERDRSGQEDYETVCTSPCDAPLTLGARYRVAGSGIRGSEPFSLASGDRETLTVSPASQAAFVGGIVMIPISGLTLLVGALVGLVGTAIDANDSSHPATGTEMGGYSVALAGLAGVIGGVVLVVSNRHSDVSQSASPAATIDSPWRRTATWRDASPEQRIAREVGSAPLLRMSF